MTVYEGMFILDSTKYSRDPDTVTGQLNDLIANGGTVLVTTLGRRKLAYQLMASEKVLIGSSISASMGQNLLLWNDNVS